MSVEVKEYDFCKVCQVNHNAGRKHIYSKTHTKKLKSVLSRFMSKMKEAKRAMKHPRAEMGEFEPSVNIWCYCCQQEVKKHFITKGETTVKWGGIIEHIASSEHHKNTRHWFWENGCDIQIQPQFLVHQLEYDQYKDTVEPVIAEAEKAIAMKRHQEAIAIKQQEIQRSFLISQSNASQDFTRGTPTTKEVKARTSLEIKPAKKIRGNVHTGATPPWLRNESDSEEGEAQAVIGPSEDAFKEHLSAEKKRKRNPNRVGADFAERLKEKAVEDDATWLPSFGRVWNYGPRSHSKAQFFSGRKQKSPEGSAIFAQAKPYVSKSQRTNQMD